MIRHSWPIQIIGIAGILFLTACSSKAPLPISLPVPAEPTIQQVRATPDNYIAQMVRWGGVIVATDNRGDSTWLTIVAFPLDKKGQPIVSDQPSGRFIAMIDRFLEPLVYSKDRQLTVKGDFMGSTEKLVGEYPYQYLKVKVENYHLWPKKIEYNVENYPLYWHHDHWYYPGIYPRYPYPYRLIPKQP